MRELVLVAQLRKMKVRTAGFFGLTDAVNPLQNKRLAATLLAAVLILVLIGAWVLRGAGAAQPAAISSGSGADSADITTQSSAQTPPQSAQSSVSVNSSSSSGGSASNSSNVNVNIDGQNVNVPQNGSIHKVIQNGDSTTTIDVNHSSTGSASNSSNVQTNVSVDSDSTTTAVQGGDSQ